MRGPDHTVSLFARDRRPVIANFELGRPVMHGQEDHRGRHNAVLPRRDGFTRGFRTLVELLPGYEGKKSLRAIHGLQIRKWIIFLVCLRCEKLKFMSLISLCKRAVRFRVELKAL
jgi:hypothetical protein